MDFTIESNSLLSLNLLLWAKNGRDSSVVPCAKRRRCLLTTIVLKQPHPPTPHNMGCLVTRTTLVPLALVVPAIGERSHPPLATSLQPPPTRTPLRRSSWIHSLTQNEIF